MMKKIKIINLKIKSIISSLRWYEKIQWFALLVILVFSFFTMCYDDFLYFSEHSYFLLKMLLTGRMEYFYSIFTSNYGFTIWIIYMIWNIPLFFTDLAMGGASSIECAFSIRSVGVLLWDKLLLLITIFFLLCAMLKIARVLGMKKELEGGLLFVTLSSFLLIVTVVQLTQYDVICLTIALWGITYYLYGNNKWFLILFAIANPMKYLTLLVFIPLVLLRYKKVWEVIMWMLGGSSLIISNIFLRKLISGYWTEAYNNIMISQLTAESSSDNLAAVQIIPELPTYLGNIVSGISLFILFYMLICIVAYAIPKQNNSSKWSIYLVFSVYVDLLLFFDCPAYRMVMLCPFLIILIFTNQRFFNLGIILETVIGLSAILVKTYESAWVVGGHNTFEHLILKGKTIHSNLSDFIFGKLEFGGYIGVIKTILVASLIGIIFLYIPTLQKSKEEREAEKPEQCLMWIRLFLLIGWTGITTYSLLF